MYTPRSFRIEHLPTLHALIQDFSFGVLVSQDGARPVATHVPFMVDAARFVSVTAKDRKTSWEALGLS